MADGQHYDVVIIGTGAGGGTLGHRLATNGAKCSGWSEGRSCHGSATTGRPRRCSYAGSTSRKSSGMTGTATSSSLRSTTTSGGRRSSAVRTVPPPYGGLR
jgi:thioredoxin reductase